MRGRLMLILGLIISGVALWMVVRSIDVGATLTTLATADLRLLILILGIIALQVVLRAIRWSHLIPTTPRIGFARLIPPLLIGYLGNAVLPARLGEPMRAVIVSRRERIDMVQALGTVLLERIIDVASLAPIALLAAIVTRAPMWAIQVAAITTIAGGTVVAVLATSGIQPLLRMADRLALTRRASVRSVTRRLAYVLGGSSRRRPMALAAGISVTAWMLDAASFWLAAQALGIEISFAAATLVAAITVLGTAIPSAPGYVGTFELAASSIAIALGVPPESAVAMAILAHAMTLLPPAVAGTVSLIVVGGTLGEVATAARSDGAETAVPSRQT